MTAWTKEQFPSPVLLQKNYSLSWLLISEAVTKRRNCFHHWFCLGEVSDPWCLDKRHINCKTYITMVPKPSIRKTRMKDLVGVLLTSLQLILLSSGKLVFLLQSVCLCLSMSPFPCPVSLFVCDGFVFGPCLGCIAKNDYCGTPNLTFEDNCMPSPVVFHI